MSKIISEDVLEYISITELNDIINEKLKKHRGLVCCPENCFCWEFEQDIFNKISERVKRND